jgi:serine/threonine protein kinase
MVYELCEKGSLVTESSTGPVYKEAEVRQFFQQLILGIEYCKHCPVFLYNVDSYYCPLSN